MKNKYYVVFDTNVIISAFLSSKTENYSALLLDYIYDEVVVPIYSDEILCEYKEVLSRDKFPFTKKAIGDFINSLKEVGIKINPNKLNIDFIDIDDLVFYEVLMNKDQFNKKLVTGNSKHFPKQVNIKTPKEMYELIIKNKHYKE